MLSFRQPDIHDTHRPRIAPRRRTSGPNDVAPISEGTDPGLGADGSSALGALTKVVLGVEQSSGEALSAASRHRTDAPLRALIAEYSGPVYRLARSIVKDPGLADDVTQETFIKVWKHLDDFRGDGSMRGWVLRIAHRESVAALRRRRESATDPDDLAHPPDPIAVGQVVEGRFAFSAFGEALDELDELSRAVLVLRELEGMSYEDIADVLDVPLPTVKTRLLRARRTMSTRLEGWRS
ncbi:MAG TPA: RNA polymerase sigma factor [Ilumatobacter sp.]|nr:RNA polymerase sigma factor [Ilumatobacter sp.]